LLDEKDRRVFLRGVNVGGKLPLGHRTPSVASGTFVGSLFPVETIETHLQRLVSCGFNVVRLNVTWEAIESEYEGRYDLTYIQYLLSVVRSCAKYNLLVIIDSHQDAWSRWTGGDGAPKWTMTKLGLDVDAFTETRSALLHGDDSGHMTWFTNYSLYGAATMFTLFFGGNRFAPNTKVNGQNVQDWLQSAYIRAWCEVAKALKNEPNVLGFEPMNEPNAGWIGVTDLRRIQLPVFFGWDLSPWKSIRLANGDSFDVASFPTLNAYKQTERANPSRRCVWNKGRVVDVWKENGVWDGELKDCSHFKLQPGESFESDFLAPFIRRFASAIQGINWRWWILSDPKVDNIPNSIYSPHWYDNVTLVMNRHIRYLVISDSRSFVYPYIASQTHKQTLKTLATKSLCFLGEFGTPWLGEYETPKALESTMSALDSSFVAASTLWNYNPHHRTDDNWNIEDFSIWHQNAFRMPTAVRPYAMVLAGKPVSMEWKALQRGKPFTLVFDPADARSNVSLIFVPEMHFRSGIRACASDGGSLVHDWASQTLEYRHCREVKGDKVLKIVEKR